MVMLSVEHRDLTTLKRFDRWRIEDACLHEDMIYIHHRIGNVARVGRLWDQIDPSGALEFPLLLIESALQRNPLRRFFFQLMS